MKVLIIGSGLAGPVLALALRQHGISCKIFELRDKSAFEGGFVALAPNALRALDRIGMYERISKQGWNYEHFQFVSARNLKTIGTVLNGSQRRYGYKALRISRGIVRQTLLDALDQQGIELHYDSKCVKIEETAHATVRATFADGRVEEADFLIGADGIHSRVRNALDPNAVPTFSGLMGVGGSFPRSTLPASAQNMYMPCMMIGKLNSFAFMPCDYAGSRIGCFATIETKERSREEWNVLQSDKTKMHDFLRATHQDEDWPEVVHTATEGVDLSSISLWPYYKVPKLASWSSRSGRVIVIGDAAHAMPPTGGQGAAMAFEDAVTLADTLARLNSKDTAVAEPIQRWQAVRQARAVKILAFTSRGGDMRKASVSTLQQIIKEWAMWLYFWWMNEDIGLSWIYEYDTQKLEAA